MIQRDNDLMPRMRECLLNHQMTRRPPSNHHLPLHLFNRDLGLLEGFQKKTTFAKLNHSRINHE